MTYEDGLGNGHDDEYVSGRLERERGHNRIRYWFIPRTIPSGDAPIEVRREWVDVPLPVRYDRSPESPEPRRAREVISNERVFMPDAVDIEAVDAVRSLELFGRADVASWWIGHYGGLSNLPMRILYFEFHEGRILTPELTASIYPEIESFDT